MKCKKNLNKIKFTKWYINAGITSSNDKILECVDTIKTNTLRYSRHNHYFHKQ
ncbi:hypothetical protein H8356DRAFT_1354654 [Neocallimastix lanati (nom. inval.)]|nr:hypothetical protein H8356DRAFT_1354654 [Neocallimastix sp. JGI-2020a]